MVLFCPVCHSIVFPGYVPEPKKKDSRDADDFSVSDDAQETKKVKGSKKTKESGASAAKDRYYCRKCEMYIDDIKVEAQNKEKTDAIKRHTEASIEAVDEEGIALPVDQTIDCPQCGKKGAYFYSRQNRAADEAETMYYTCCACKFKWSL